MSAITNKIFIDLARNHGFDLIGFADYRLLTNEMNFYKEWINKGFNGEMKYLENNLDKREDVSLIFHDVKSVVSLGLNYQTSFTHSDKPNFGKVSRYAWGKDYHLIIWEKLDILISELKKIDSNFDAKSYVDTGPVLDKVWGVSAGLGWMGKHTNIINKEIGSYFFISTILTNYIFEPSPIVTDHCGSCTACIDACPTDAIINEYQLDASKCISYLTIENKNDIPNVFKGKFENWIFGCDICQDVCPWNKKFSVTCNTVEFNPINGNNEINLLELNSMTKEEFSKKFKESPVKRGKLKGLKRNGEFLIGNS
ncbi:MAG: tRNA epoxyqueuosine(34) reductase QueG [Ignavibacteriaceae bacterium]|nr:tRNA epoxyqueuosine(34) reductase QueG [Ignavibacteriaceae bacterium]